MSEIATLNAYLEARRAEIDAALGLALPTSPRCPPIMAEAMRYSLFAGGKRLRPVLALASAEAAAPNAASESERSAARALALPAACAIEMIHTYSLIHDDLPAMDNDTLRRGRPTAHVVYGEAMAILAGDGLLTEAFGLLARRPETSDPAVTARKLRTAARIAEAAGACGMVGGQVLDLAPAGSDVAAIADVHARKTGALMQAAAVAGAVMAGAAEAVITAIDRFAAELGLAFQIIDDVLDVEGLAKDLGKTAGKDAAAGKPTFVTVHGIDGSRRMARECVDRACAALDSVRLGRWLPEIARWVIERNN